MEYAVNNQKTFKTNKFLEYFTGKKSVDVTDKNFENAIILDKMIEIYNSDEDSLDKYYQMKSIYKSTKDFRKTYNFLDDFKEQNDVKYLLTYIELISNFIAEIESKLSKEEEKELFYLKKNYSFEDYPYAAYFVSEYIEYNDSPYKKDFLEDKGILEFDFKRFLQIVIDLDYELYEKYLAKEEENKRLRQSETIRKLENIKSGATTGFDKEGKKFDFVEFYCNLPFYDIETSSEIIEDFELKKTPSVDKRLKSLLDAFYPENSGAVMRYVYTNNLLRSTLTKISENDIKKTNYIINEQQLSDEGKEEIISYMKGRNIPFLNCSFNAVKNKYFKEGLEKSSQKTLRK